MAVKLSNKMGVLIFRGVERDVLSRYYYCAKAYKADHIVRITSDCPLIDPKIIDLMIRRYLLDSSQQTRNN